MAVKELGISLISRFTDCPVGILLIGPQKRQRHGLTIELYSRGSIQVLILRNELVFLLHQLHNGGRKAAGGDLKVFEHQGAVVPLQLRPVGGFEQRRIDPVGQLLQLGADLIHVIIFGIVELILGIDSMTDVGDLLHGSGRLHLLFIGVIGCYLPSRIGSGFHGFQRLGSCSGQRFHIWAAVRHLTKLHSGTSFRYFI